MFSMGKVSLGMYIDSELFIKCKYAEKLQHALKSKYKSKYKCTTEHMWQGVIESNDSQSDDSQSDDSRCFPENSQPQSS